MCLIGEAFDNSDDVCGAVVNVRAKGDKIGKIKITSEKCNREIINNSLLGVWTADASNSSAVLEIGRKLKDRLRIPQKVTIGYQVHKDTMDKAGSVTKQSYTV